MRKQLLIDTTCIPVLVSNHPGWNIGYNRPIFVGDGTVYWDEKRIELVELDPAACQSFGQYQCRNIFGHYYDHPDKVLLNACFFSFLNSNTNLIPKKWEVFETIIFLGTLFRNPFGHNFARALTWNGKRWSHTYNSIEYFPCEGRAAVPLYMLSS